jgi:hypothetical protein
MRPIPTLASQHPPADLCRHVYCASVNEATEAAERVVNRFAPGGPSHDFARDRGRIAHWMEDIGPCRSRATTTGAASQWSNNFRISRIDLHFHCRGIVMKHILMTATLAALIAAGTCAVAQDQPSQGSQPTQSDNNPDSHNKSMKQCMARQKATNSGLTNLQMRTTCKNEMKGDKTRKDGNDLATGTQSGDQQPKEQ